MKKVKLLVPTLACSVVAITPLVSMTSCGDPEPEPVDPEIDKKVDHHTIINNMIYGVNKEGQIFELDDKQMSEIDNCFLAVKVDGSLNEYKGINPETEKPYTISDFIMKADKEQIWGYELYLGRGVYEFGESTDTQATMNTFYIRGLNDYQGNKMSSIKGYKGEETEESHGESTLQTVVLNERLNLLQFNNVNIIGSKYETTKWSNWGIKGSRDGEGNVSQVNMMYFMNCDFIGKVSLDATQIFFTNCHFDSTAVKIMTSDQDEDALNKTDYCVWLCNAEYAYFYWCDFVTHGKAIKVWRDQEWPAEGIVYSQYVLNHCNFTIKNNEVPTPEDSPSDPDENKYCLEIDNLRNGANIYDENHPLYVYCKDINGRTKPSEKTEGDLCSQYINEIDEAHEDKEGDKFFGLVGKRNDSYTANCIANQGDVPPAPAGGDPYIYWCDGFLPYW